MIELDPTDLQRARDGDVRAMDALYRVYGDRVYRLCLGILGQPADAEDAASDVLLRVLHKAATFSGRSRFSTWVYRLTMNHCLNSRTQRRRHPVPMPLWDLQEPEQPRCAALSPLESSIRAEERSTLHDVLQRLRPEHRAVVVLREVEGLSYQDIAEVLEIPVGTVMSRLSRGRAALAELTASLQPRPRVTGARPRFGTNGWKP